MSKEENNENEENGKQSKVIPVSGLSGASDHGDSVVLEELGWCSSASIWRASLLIPPERHVPASASCCERRRADVTEESSAQ